MHRPKCDRLIAGSPLEVTWDIPEGPPAQSVILLSSFDDGASWAGEADRLLNTGTCSWTVPATTTDRARLKVMLINETDETGAVSEAEFAVSDSFSIGTAPTGVEDNAPSIR